MEKEQWLKAINCTKEQLIEWLNEMYEDEKLYREIIDKYQEYTKAGEDDNYKDTGKKYVLVAYDFIYHKNW